MLSLPLSLLSPAGASARLSILVLHRVLPAADPMFPGEIDIARFDAMCVWAKSWFNVLPLDEAMARRRCGSLPARALAISFDDGYADNHDVALPVLQRHCLTATFFIATGFLDGGRMWNDTLIEAMRTTSLPRVDLSGLGIATTSVDTGSHAERAASAVALIAAVKYLPPAQRAEVVQDIAERAAARLPDDLMMRSSQVRALRAAGMQVGAHTVSHPILARLEAPAALAEIGDSKAQLESLLGERVGLFAYPNGKPGEDYLPGSVDLVRRAGFDAAFTTAWGAARAQTDDLQMPRFTPWDRTRWRFGLRMAGNLMR